MREIWFVDSADARTFHLYPTCPALEQAVQPVFSEQVAGLAEIVGTARFGDLRPCERCRQRAELEEGASQWAKRLKSSSPAAADALKWFLKGQAPSAAQIEGKEPLRTFQQNLRRLRVYTDRLEIVPPSLFSEPEPTAIPFTQIRDVRAISWIPLIRMPAVEIDSELDGEVFTDKFSMSILDSPEMVAASTQELVGATARPAGLSAFSAQTAEDAAPQADSAGGGGGGGSSGDGLRGELARLYDEGRRNGGSFSGAGGPAGVPFNGSGWDFADGVLAGCNDPESLKALAELLDEQVRLAKFFVEANANPLVVESWNRLEVTIDGCDIDWDWIPYTPGGPDDPFKGGGGAGKGGGGKGKKSGKPKPQQQGPREDPDEEWLRRHFPNMDLDRIKITGSRGKYNCAGHALGKRKEIWPTKAPDFYIDENEFEYFLAVQGWSDDPKGDRTLVVWRNEARGIVHVSLENPDGSLESKFGLAGPQVIHSIDDMEGNNFYPGMEIVERRVGRVVDKPVKPKPKKSDPPPKVKG